MEKEAAACSRRPTSPISVKYFPEQIPSSSGDTTSSDTADSSRTLEEIFCGRAKKKNTGSDSRQVGAKQQCVQPAATSDLEGDASHGQVLAVLQHAEVFRHQGGAMHQALGRLGVVVPLGVLPRHVLEPREPQVRRRLVALGDPEAKTGRRT